jgi:iron complex outermembrane receptor protein
MKISPITLCLTTGIVLSCPVHAETSDVLIDEVLVTANRFVRKDTEATYSSEVHAADEIKNSGLTSLYDFLTQKTSLNISSGYGNTVTPLIDVRGYGLEAGYQNVVITVDGQRLNNTDQSPQLIGAIPLKNVDRIEITKGSGSVINGDGATGGSIQIYTKTKTGVSLSGSGGNYGNNNETLSAGLNEKYIELSAIADRNASDGYMQRDITGTSNGLSSNTQNGKMKLKPREDLDFTFDFTNSFNNLAYVSYLSPNQFFVDPTSNSRPYLRQRLDSRQYKIGSEYRFNDVLKFKADHYIEDKTSSYVTSGYDYYYQSNDFNLTYEDKNYSFVLGYWDFDGKRSNPTQYYFGLISSLENNTRKNNKAIYVATEYKPEWFDNKLTLSAGGREEFVNYNYNPVGATTLSDNANLDAWDFGLNYKLLDSLSIFSNFNKSFQAPDIDRFFQGIYYSNPNDLNDPLNGTFVGQQFNGFIKPAQVRTLNIGLNHELKRNKLKITAFRSNLSDEIVSNPLLWTSTNIDKSHKYGFEIQDFFTLTEKLTGSVIYTYTKARIDQFSTYDTANGRLLPGVPKSTISANLTYEPYKDLRLTLNQSYRSSSFAMANYLNDSAYKQTQYESTNFIVNYKYKNYSLFGSINNLFEHRNNLAVLGSSLALYPIDIVRTWRLGTSIDF